MTKDPTPTAERSDLRKPTEGSSHPREEVTKDPTPTAERSDLRKPAEGSAARSHPREEATQDPTPTAERSDLREEATQDPTPTATEGIRNRLIYHIEKSTGVKRLCIPQAVVKEVLDIAHTAEGPLGR